VGGRGDRRLVPEPLWVWVEDPGTSEMVPKPTWGWEEATKGHPGLSWWDVGTSWVVRELL